MDIVVSPTGWVTWGERRFPCALGRSGVRVDKREGDGATPVGCWPFRRVLYRPDRLAIAPVTRLPLGVIAPDDGWCDDPTHADYNQAVKLPHPASCERMWREDAVYDVVVVLKHNDSPAIPGHGSAIFLHVAKPEWTATEGCVALEQADLLDLLRECGPGDHLCVALTSAS